MDDLTRTALVRRVRALEDALERLRDQEKHSNYRIQTLERAAYHDALTGLPNRRALNDCLGGWYVMADLNGFKRAQDAHPRGHAYGDDILIEFAEFLLGEIRSGHGRQEDRIAVRMGGDEFVVWCPNRPGALRIRNVIRTWVSSCGAVTAGAGMGRDLASADAALYINKKAA